MRIHIHDELGDTYGAYATKAGLSVDTVVNRQLERFRSIDPYGQVIALGDTHLAILSEKLHGGQIQSAEDLVTKVENLAGISFCGIDLRLTPAQLRELSERAARQGKTVEDLIHEIWAKLSTDFFYAGAAVGG